MKLVHLNLWEMKGYLNKYAHKEQKYESLTIIDK